MIHFRSETRKRQPGAKDCLRLASGSREFSRDSAFSRSRCQARSWGGRLFSPWETTKTWQAPSKHNLQILSLGGSHKTRSCDHLRRDILPFSNSSGNEGKLWLFPCFLGQSSRKPLVPSVFRTRATRVPSSTWAGPPNRFTPSCDLSLTLLIVNLRENL